METFKRAGAFVAGTSLGAGIGAAVATLIAPESGDELKQRLKRRADDVRRAGERARQAKETELAARFRSTVNDPDALTDEEMAPADRGMPHTLR